MGTKTGAREWVHRTGRLPLGKRTLLMGIVNVTPDSFSDGGQFLDSFNAAVRALDLSEAGADIVDFGAESTRPGSDSVSAEEQIRRLLPVFEKLRGILEIPLSVDTTSAEVADACLEAGASIVNDISGFHADSDLPAVCAKHRAGVALMHRRGIPKTMQQDTEYANLFREIRTYLEEGLDAAERAGIPQERIVVDPGIGFGKSFEQNYLLLGSLQQFQGLGAGVLAGPSRKAFTGEFNGLPADKRQWSTAAAVSLAVLHGADAVRIHDVREMRQVVDILDRFRELHG